MLKYSIVAIILTGLYLVIRPYTFGVEVKTSDTKTDIFIADEKVTQTEYDQIKTSLAAKLIEDSLTTKEAQQMKDIARKEGGVYLKNRLADFKTKARKGTISNEEIRTWLALENGKTINNFSGSMEDLKEEITK